jgi:hypothetical protein
MFLSMSIYADRKALDIIFELVILGGVRGWYFSFRIQAAS